MNGSTPNLQEYSEILSKKAVTLNDINRYITDLKKYSEILSKNTNKLSEVIKIYKPDSHCYRFLHRHEYVLKSMVKETITEYNTMKNVFNDLHDKLTTELKPLDDIRSMTESILKNGLRPHDDAKSKTETAVNGLIEPEETTKVIASGNVPNGNNADDGIEVTNSLLCSYISVFKDSVHLYWDNPTIKNCLVNSNLRFNKIKNKDDFKNKQFYIRKHENSNMDTLVIKSIQQCGKSYFICNDGYLYELVDNNLEKAIYNRVIFKWRYYESYKDGKTKRFLPY